LGVALVLGTYRYALPSGQAELLGRSLRREMAFWLPWAPLTPGLAWLGRRLARYLEHRERRLLLAMPLAALAVVMYALLAAGAARLFGVGRAEGNLAAVGFQFLKASWPWATVVSVCIIGLSIAAQYRQRIHFQKREAAELRRQLVEAQLATLRMQLQPHFLFNTLHAISVLVGRNPEAATAMIARLGDLLRATLDLTHRQEVSLREELALLEMYLEIERMRFGDRLSVEVAASPDTLDCPVPSFLLQPLVENAIHQGIEAKVGAGSIRVTARRDNGWLNLQVVDNGEGVSPESGREARQGVGIANTRERLQKLYGTAHQFSLDPCPDGGTAAVIQIPDRISASPEPSRGTAAVADSRAE
jgi:signal transduction histidine kinase